jgi:hypothetical protein
VVIAVKAETASSFLGKKKPYLPKLSDSSLSRQIERLHIFGMIKRVPGTYRCYLT